MGKLWAKVVAVWRRVGQLWGKHDNKTKLRWIFYEFSGIRAIWERISPLSDEEKKKGRKPAPTFVLWFFGLYTALFGLVSARHENAVDRVEIRAGAVVALLANDSVRQQATFQVANVQKRKVPKQPVFGGFLIDTFWEWETHDDAVEMMKDAIVSCKKELAGADLRGADLSKAAL